MFVFSPSNMMNYRLCPRRFEGQSITKEIKWKASMAKSRGSLVHKALEEAMSDGYDSVTKWPDDLCQGYVQEQILWGRELVETMEHRLYIEKELTVSRQWAKTGWWDDDAYLRAKADMILVPPLKYPDMPVHVVDFKTGKKWDTDDFQLRVEALLCHILFDRPVVSYAYWYVDAGETVDMTIDFRNGIQLVQDVVELISEMDKAIANKDFPSKKNRFCKYCDFYNTPLCGL